MIIGKKSYENLIKLDNFNDKRTEVDLNTKLLKIGQNFTTKLDTLKNRKYELESLFKANKNEYKEILLNIEFINDGKNRLLELKNSIATGFDIKTITKYTLSNYKSLPIGKSYGIVKEYVDFNKPVIVNGFNIEGYINYCSVVNGNVIHKHLVILDKKEVNIEGGKGYEFDNKSDKVVYSIDDNGELKLDNNFSIVDGIYIKENRGDIINDTINNKLRELKKEGVGKIIDTKVEKEIEINSYINDSINNLINDIESDGKGTDYVEGNFDGIPIKPKLPKEIRQIHSEKITNTAIDIYDKIGAENFLKILPQLPYKISSEFIEHFIYSENTTVEQLRKFKKMKLSHYDENGEEFSIDDIINKKLLN